MYSLSIAFHLPLQRAQQSKEQISRQIDRNSIGQLLTEGLIQHMYWSKDSDRFPLLPEPIYDPSQP